MHQVFTDRADDTTQMLSGHATGASTTTVASSQVMSRHNAKPSDT